MIQRLDPNYRSRHSSFLKHWDHQFYLWGQDVKSGPIDWLKHFGFERFDAERELSNSPAYRLATSQMEIWLWAYGAFLGFSQSSHGIFISRHGLIPQLYDHCTLSDPFLLLKKKELLRKPYGLDEWTAARDLFRYLLHWCADYETQTVKNSRGRHRKEPRLKSGDITLPLDLAPYWTKQERSLDCYQKKNRAITFALGSEPSIDEFASQSTPATPLMGVAEIY